MIPQIIHYCWFGGNNKPEIILKCISSWKEKCPSFQIKEWNETNFDINSCNYIKEAYDQKKWAFVSDYARHAILYSEGGIYLDTDVELIKDITPLLQTPILAMEKPTYLINSGLIMACDKNDSYCKEMVELYKKTSFLESPTTTVCQRTTELFKKHGFTQEDKIQNCLGYTLYPSEYFSPKDPSTNKIKLTPNTYAIHHYAASWYSPWMSFMHQMKLVVSALLGPRFANKITKILKRQKSKSC